MITNDTNPSPPGASVGSNVGQTSGANAPVFASPKIKQGASGVGLWLAILACIGALAVSFFLWQRQHLVESELSRKAQASDTRVQELSVLLKANQDNLKEVQGRLTLTESKVADSVSQQAQLEKLYRELARNRDDWELADAEQAVQMASQQLQAAGNVRAALAAMQDADARLSRVNQPAQIGVRRLLARDIEKLQVAQATDTTSVVNQMDSWITSVDKLPMIAPDKVQEESQKVGASSKSGGLLKRLTQMPQDGLEALRDELSGLFKIRKIDSPEAMFVAPEQAFYARENLKLRLASARLAVLARNDSLMRNELARSLEFVQKYFDNKDKSVDALRTGMLKLRAAPGFEPPSLTESLAAVRSLRQKER